MRLLAFIFILLAVNIAAAAVKLDRKLIQTLKISKTRALVIDACFSPDGKTLYAAWCKENSDGGGLTAWDVKTGKLKRIFMQRPVDKLGISPDGKTLVCHHSEETLRVWDTVTGRLKHTLSAWGFAFSPDGKLFATGIIVSEKNSVEGQGRVIIRDAKNWRVQRVFRTGFTNTPKEIAFSSDGKLLAASTFYGDAGFGALQVWNCRTGKTLQYFDETDGFAGFFLPSTHVLISGNQKLDLNHSKSRFQPVFRKDIGSRFIGSWPHHENLRLYHGFDKSSHVKQKSPNDFSYPFIEFLDWWDIKRQQCVARWKNQPTLLKEMAFSPDGKFCAEWCEPSNNDFAPEIYANAIKIYRLTLDSG